MLPPLSSDRSLPPIVALCGPAGVGKTTVARALARLAPTIQVDMWPPTDPTLRIGDVVHAQPGRLPTEGVVVPLAHPLKQMLRVLGVPEPHLTGTLAEKEQPLDLLCGRTARWAMQSLGTEWGRECIHPELWLRAWEQHARNASSNYPHSLVIVDDVRFDNEADYLRKLGAVVLRLSRSGVHEPEGPSHASERGVTRYHGSLALGLASNGELHNATMLLEAVLHADLRLRPDDSPLRRLLKTPAPQTGTSILDAVHR